jgi:hypothetical protein
MGGEVIPFSFSCMAGFCLLTCHYSSDVSDHFVLLVIAILIVVMTLRVGDGINEDN